MRRRFARLRRVLGVFAPARLRSLDKRVARIRGDDCSGKGSAPRKEFAAFASFLARGGGPGRGGFRYTLAFEWRLLIDWRTGFSISFRIHSVSPLVVRRPGVNR